LFVKNAGGRGRKRNCGWPHRDEVTIVHDNEALYTNDCS